MQTDTQQALKDRIVAALIMNGWATVFEHWWRSYNRGSKIDQETADKAVSSYLNRLADDLAEALVNGHYPDGTIPRPDVLIDGEADD